MNRRFLNMGILCLLLTVSLSASWSQTVGRIEFENDALMVVRVHMAPGEKTPMHDIDSPRLVIWLTDAHLKDTGADGKISEYERPAGSMDWITPRRHVGENMSDLALDFLAIIPKRMSQPGACPMSPH